MKKIFFTACIVFITSILSAQEKNYIDQNYIEITGRAEKEVVPDEIYLNITIKEKDNKDKSSLEKQEKELLKRLTALGIDLKTDMQIMDMSTLMQKYLLKKDMVITSKSYQLKVTSTELLVKVFQELEALSIPDASIVKTSLSNIEEVRQEVTIMAAQSARQSAESLAKSLGRNLGKPIFIQCYDNYTRVIKTSAMVRGAMLPQPNMMEFVAPSLDFEKIKFEQSILIRFCLE